MGVPAYSELKLMLIGHLRPQIPAVPGGEHLRIESSKDAGAMNTTQLRVTGRIEPVSSSAYTKTQDFPAAGTWSTWPASDRYPRCSLLPPPHSHVPAQDARGEGGSRILNTTSLSSARTWVRSPPREHRVLGEPCPS